MKPSRRFLILAFVLFSFTLHAKIIYVVASATGSNNGTCWADAYVSLQSALTASISGDTIWVAKGKYYPSVMVGGSTERYKTFQMKHGVQIYGGFIGTETTCSMRRDFGFGGTNATILSGDVGTLNDSTDNCYHVFYHPTGLGLTNSDTLNGFVITGGNANGTSPHNSGGGMYLLSNSPTLVNVTFVSNAASDGGGLYNNLSSPTCINILVCNNTATSSGGGIYIDQLTPTFINATICNNYAGTGGGCNMVSSPNSVFENCIIWGNTALKGNQFAYKSNCSTILHYCCYANGTNDVVRVSGNGTFTALTDDNITSDPIIVDAVRMDYRLSTNSPCKNTGLNSYNTSSMDIRGQSRIQNITIDRGAYEWTMGHDDKINYVNYQASGYNNGTSWHNAFTSVQAALSAVDSGKQIWVAKGVYKPDTSYDLPNSPRYYHFRMKHGVQIFGGFAGTETTVSQRRDFGFGGVNETILSGDVGILNDSTDNCYHVFYHPSGLGLTISDTLNGFTITGGNANGTYPHGYGGGIYNSNSSSPALTNVTISSNTASDYGGGIYNYDHSSPTLTNVTISSNTASDYGGGIYNSNSSSPILTNVTISSNAASTGGGIYIIYSSLTLRNSIVWGNMASSGKQLYIEDASSVTLQYSCYANGTNDVYMKSGGTFTTDETDITNDPQFLYAAHKDYRLSTYSPCKNTGLNSYNTSSMDIRGQSRIQNITIDRGAYEWTVGDDADRMGNEDIIYVNYQALGNNNGTNWHNAYTSLQVALSAAVSGKQIWVAKGIYKPSSAHDLTNTPRYYHFRMKHGVQIYGGFAGTETTVSQRLNFGYGQTNETTLSGDLNNNGKDDNDCYHVFYHPSGLGLTISDTLNGFTITGGNANDTYPHGYGGGIYNYSSSPTLTNVTISNNNANICAGGIYNYSSSPTLTDVTISNNTANSGGGIENVNYSSPSLTNVTISSNTAIFYGGGISNNQHSSSTLTNVIINSNTATGGGGIYNYDYSSPTLTNVTITSNTANYGGGIYNSYSSSLTLTNVIISSNTANYGGGIDNCYSSSLTLTNVTISSNTANYGGGIYNDGDSSALRNSIVWGNTISNSGLGKQFYLRSGRVILQYSCYAYGSNDIYIYGGGTFTTDETDITTDPQFLDTTNHDFRLASTSPCLDKGYDAFNTESFDIRGTGYPRKVNKTDGSAGTIDMGAYEYQPRNDPLPVELASFTATVSGKSVTLNWQTATEVNNYGFNVERCKGQGTRDEAWKKGTSALLSASWETLGFVQGHGNSNSPKSYSFVDANPVAGKVQYRLKQIDFDGKYEYSDVVELKVETPVQFKLAQNFPNPFNPETTIKYSIPGNVETPGISRTSLRVYDLLGREVATLVNEQKAPGNYEVKFDGSNLASGVYFYKLQSGQFTQTKKLLLMK